MNECNVPIENPGNMTSLFPIVPFVLPWRTQHRYDISEKESHFLGHSSGAGSSRHEALRQLWPPPRPRGELYFGNPRYFPVGGTRRWGWKHPLVFAKRWIGGVQGGGSQPPPTENCDRTHVSMDNFVNDENCRLNIVYFEFRKRSNRFTPKFSCVEFILRANCVPNFKRLYGTVFEISCSGEIYLWRNNRRTDLLITTKLSVWSFQHISNPYTEFQVSNPRSSEDVAVPRICFGKDVQTNGLTELYQKFLVSSWAQK